MPKDKVAIVTGASRGIGRSIALALAGEGARIVAVDLGLPETEALVAEIKAVGGEALAVQMVIGNRSAITFDPRQPMITLTSGITMDMANTALGTPWNQALWTMAVVLLVISVTFVVVVRRLSRRREVG